eukprot:scaffold80557_cov31-Tisochrysis_lutea.AAC.4
MPGAVRSLAAYSKLPLNSPRPQKRQSAHCSPHPAAAGGRLTAPRSWCRRSESGARAASGSSDALDCRDELVAPLIELLQHLLTESIDEWSKVGKKSGDTELNGGVRWHGGKGYRLSEPSHPGEERLEKPRQIGG